MLNKFLLICLALGFLGLVSFITYKITLPLGLKIIDLCFDSPVFCSRIFFCFAITFFIVGILQFKDYFELSSSSLSLFFPLSFFLSGIFVYLGLLKR